MNKLPECLIHITYKLRHEVMYSKVMKQLKAYRLNTVFIVSLKSLEHGYYEFSIRTPCININNINSTSYETLCLINHKRDTLSHRWCRPYGGVL